MNPVDYKMVEWDFPPLFSVFPRNVGVDVSGVVVRVGSAVDANRFKVGVTGVYGHTAIL